MRKQRKKTTRGKQVTRHTQNFWKIMLGKFGMLLAPAARSPAEASSRSTGSRTSCTGAGRSRAPAHTQRCQHCGPDSWGCRGLGAAPAGIARAHLSRPSGSGARAQLPTRHSYQLAPPAACPRPSCWGSACPPALQVWSKDRKTWKELKELSLFSLRKVLYK